MDCSLWATGFGRYAIREIRLARIALSERLRDKNLTGGSMPPVPGA
jgi:hypothetical protein